MQPRELNPAYYGSVAGLWSRCLGDRWPISDEDLKLYLFSPLAGIAKTNLGFLQGETVVALVSSHQCGSQAGLLLVLVDPAHRREGLGRRLVLAAAKCQHAAGATGIKVGSVGCGYLWPGVPDDCLGGKVLFEGLGFQTGSMQSLVIGTAEYASHGAVPADVSIRLLAPEESDKLMAMQTRCAFGWESDFARPISQGRHRDVVVAVKEGAIVGALTLKGPEQHHLWRKKLGERMGEIDNVGVEEAQRRRGIGLGLVGHATQVLRERGVEKVLIGNTWLKDWYGRLGYRVWSEWITCKAELPLAAGGAPV